MRPATEPAAADDLLVLRARRAERGLPAVLTDVDAVVAFLAALVVVAFRVAGFLAEALVAVALAVGALAAEVFTATRFLAVVFLAAGLRAVLPEVWRFRWLRTITHSSSVSEEGLLP